MGLCLKARAQINLVTEEDYNALSWYIKNYSNEEQREELIKLLYAAGETVDETKVQVPDYLKPPEFSLKHLCRETIDGTTCKVQVPDYLKPPEFSLKHLCRETVDETKVQVPDYLKPPEFSLKHLCRETVDETKVQVPDYLKPPEFSLKHLCGEIIPKPQLDIDPHQHLFGRIPQLGLPSLVTEYLLSNEWVDYVEEPMKYQALRPNFFSVGGWGWWGVG